MVADPKGLAIMIAKKPMKDMPMPPPEMEDEEAGMEDEALVAAADEVIAAMNSGDAVALKDALKAFIEMAD